MHQRKGSVSSAAGMRMLTLFLRLSLAACFLCWCGVADAQQPGRIFPYQWPSGFSGDDITTADIQHALIWTGHYAGMADGAYGPYTRRGIGDWLVSKGYPKAENLTEKQAGQLVAEGLRQRDRYGWALLVDDAVGFSVGVPTAVATLQPSKWNDGLLQYIASGQVAETISVNPSQNACIELDNLFRGFSKLKGQSVTYKARSDDWFVIAGEDAQSIYYMRTQCRQQALVAAVLSIPPGENSLSFLFVEMGNSLSLRRVLRPYAKPAPRIVRPQLAPYVTASSTPVAIPNPTQSVNDHSGKTTAINLVLSDGKELRPQEVFAKASEAVYVVETSEALGSAVAISSSELLTNCHVVKGATVVTLLREGDKRAARVTSANPDSDRCVLTVSGTLPTWVKVRPYADVKVGEHAYTIGTPKGLELTLAEGIVSSKRSADGTRYIQTSAPISPGSSGGGLFDAQGNLIGITTFMLRDSQNLNFAIAAEEYAK
jgi:S1-C subfamily serine protease